MKQLLPLLFFATALFGQDVPAAKPDQQPPDAAMSREHRLLFQNILLQQSLLDRQKEDAVREVCAAAKMPLEECIVDIPAGVVRRKPAEQSKIKQNP